MPNSDQPYLKGRGAQINPANRFHQHVYESDPFLADPDHDPELRTEYLPVQNKTILNKVDSPDIGMGFSLNPYQGCEHGCVYCYARNTHTYWGYSAGIEFEQKILIKGDAPRLLEETIRKPGWKPVPIMLAGNTDIYQPAEKKYGLTRQILEILLKYRHPVGAITKNSLIVRDLDILKQLSEYQLLKVSISLTTLQEDLRRQLEPRTATVAARLRTIETLAANGIPVNVMLAPIIPGLNDHEILPMAKAVADCGARSIAYTIVRLNGDVGAIFEDWLRKNYPDRAEKVLNKIRSCHEGQLNDSRFHKRMTGEGNVAEIVKQQIQLARKKFFNGREMPAYNLELHEQFKSPQLKLF